MADEKSESESLVKTLITKLQPTQPATTETDEDEIEIEGSAKSKDDSTKNSLVTEELAKEMGLPDTWIGQPLKNVRKSYGKYQGYVAEANAKILQLESKLQNIENLLSTKQVKDAEIAANLETKNQLGRMPDPQIEPEEFAEWLEKRDQIKEQKMLKIFEEKTQSFQKSLDDNPKLKQAEEIAAQNTWNTINESIQTALPANMKADDVLNAFFENNSEEDMYTQVGDKKISIYDGKPKKFVSDVLTWLKSQSYDSLKNQKESDVIKKIQKKTKENLEKFNSKLPQKTSVNTRKEGEEKPEGVAARAVARLQASQRLKAG